MGAFSTPTSASTLTSPKTTTSNFEKKLLKMCTTSNVYASGNDNLAHCFFSYVCMYLWMLRTVNIFFLVQYKIQLVPWAFFLWIWSKKPPLFPGKLSPVYYSRGIALPENLLIEKLPPKQFSPGKIPRIFRQYTHGFVFSCIFFHSSIFSSNIYPLKMLKNMTFKLQMCFI